MISGNLDKDNLHHAYLIEGDRELILPEVFSFLSGIGIQASGNPDVCHILVDNFKIDEAINLKSMSAESGSTGGKKIFLVSSNQFSLDAQHALLKLFEEPVIDTHFFVIVPDVDVLIPTFVSRFYLVRDVLKSEKNRAEAEKFVKLSPALRLDFLKNMLIEPEDEVAGDSIKRQALSFLDALEGVLYRQTHHSGVGLTSKNNSNVEFFEHIFKVREYLRMPGSSAKNLLESLAISIPVL